jgi:hypothetical protein
MRRTDGKLRSARGQAGPLRARGSALVVILILVTVAGVIALSAIGIARTGQKIAFNDQLSKQALNIADAGIAHVMATLKNTYSTVPFQNDFDLELPSDGTAGAMSTIGNVVNLDGAGIDYRFVNFGGPAAADGYYVRLVDNRDELANDPTDDYDRRVEIISIGRVATAERELRATVLGSSTHYGLFARNTVTIADNATTDSYDGSTGPYTAAGAGSRGDVGANNDVNISPTAAVIDGNASAGGVVSLPGAVTGNVMQGAAPEFFPSVPACSPYSPAAGIVAGVYNAATGDITDDGGSLELAGGTYCFGNITVNPGAIMTITAATTIFATGDVNIAGDGINNTTLDAMNFEIRASGSTVAIQASPTAYVRIYAPDADVQLYGGNGIFGAVVGQNILLDVFSNFHFDQNTVGPATFILSDWHERVEQ